MARIDYDQWAGTYDETRGASPSVVEALGRALGPAGARSLLDIGGGTGNFAAAMAGSGFRVAVCDFSPEMTRRALTKLQLAPIVVADAQRLPFGDSVFDCALSVNVLGHIPDWRSALAEARRVLAGGPFVLKISTRETQQANWALEYLPQLARLAPLHHYQTEETIREALRDAGFRRVEVQRMYYRDLIDGSFQALKHFPEALFDDERILNTSTFMRVPADELWPAIEAIRRDHRSGRLKEVMARYDRALAEYGDASIFVCRR